MKRFVILLVDDNLGDRFLLKSMMEENNECQPIFIEASSGAEALILYEKEIADCVYLDFSMDDMTGIEFLEILHARNIQLIPTILISSHLQPSLVTRSGRTASNHPFCQPARGDRKQNANISAFTEPD